VLAKDGFVSSDAKQKLVVAFLGSQELRPNMITILQNFGELLNDHLELHLITGTQEIDSTITSYFKVFFFDSTQKNDRYGLKSARKMLKGYLSSHKPNLLINLSQPLPLGVAVSQVARKYGIAHVIRVTGDIIGEKQRARTWLGKLRKWIVYDLWITSMLKKADGTIVLGDRLKNQLVARGVSENKVEILRQPFRSGNFIQLSSEQRSLLRTKLCMDPDKSLILFVGSLTNSKGLDRLVEIIRVLSRGNGDFQYCIVGDGPLRAKIEDMKLPDTNVVGPVARKDVHKYFQAADLFVYPTRSDGLPNVILEAVNCSLPILATSVGEIPSVVRYGLTEPGQFANRILNEDYRSEEMPEWLNWSHQRDQYLKFLKRMVR
jgi:glycosyltransferase involved in cell wall biosynthesis